MGLCGSKGAEDPEPEAKGKAAGRGGGKPSDEPGGGGDSRKASVIDAVIHVQEIPDSSASGELGRTRHAKPRMRKIELQRMESQRRERAQTVEQEQFESAIDLDAEENRHVKKVVGALGVFKVTDPGERREAIENWQLLDAEREGTIAADELRLLVETLDVRLADDVVGRLLSSADPEATGRVRPREYVRTLMDARKFATERQAELLESFHVMDDGRGFVELEVLKELMGTIDDRCTPQLVDELVKREGFGADGIVSEDEFLRLMNGVDDA